MSLNVQPDRLPDLPDHRWCVWREELGKDDKKHKVPYSPLGARAEKASTKVPRDWGTRQAALDAYQQQSFDGIGFLLTGDGIVGIDLDDCRDPETGAIVPMAQTIIDRFDSYTESSPSGTGVRILLRSDWLPDERCRKGSIEVYWTRHYVTVTGHPIRDLPLADRSQEFRAWHEAIFAAVEPRSKRTPSGKRHEPSRSGLAPALVPEPASSNLAAAERAVLDRTLKNQKFARLWPGETSGYSSASEADAAFIMHIARNGATEQQADRIIRRSGLYRPKWDMPNGAGTYGSRTIIQAFEQVEVRAPARLDPTTADGAMAAVLLDARVRKYAQTLIALAVEIAARTDQPPADAWWLIRPASLAAIVWPGTRWSVNTILRHLKKLADLGGIELQPGTAPTSWEQPSRSGKRIQITKDDSLATYVRVQGRTVPEILAPFLSDS
jgi:hypothetical protein